MNYFRSLVLVSSFNYGYGDFCFFGLEGLVSLVLVCCNRSSGVFSWSVGHDLTRKGPPIIFISVY